MNILARKLSGLIGVRTSHATRCIGIRTAFLIFLCFPPVGSASGEFGLVNVGKNDAFGIINTGTTPILNPRLIAESGLDLIDFNRWLSGIYLSLPKENRSQELLLLKIWRLLGSSIYDFCSPGRAGVDPRDPLVLLGGYGYGCCSNTNPALARVASYLGFDTRLVSTPRHQFVEIKFKNGWQIVDSNRGVRWFVKSPGETLQPLVSDSIKRSKNRKITFRTALVCAERQIKGHGCPHEFWIEALDGELRQISKDDLHNEAKDHLLFTQDGTRHFRKRLKRTEFVTDNHHILYPGEKIVFIPEPVLPAIIPSEHLIALQGHGPPLRGVAYQEIRIQKGRRGVVTDKVGNIRRIKIRSMFPIVEVLLTNVISKGRDYRVYEPDTSGVLLGRMKGAKWKIGRPDLERLEVDRELAMTVTGQIQSLIAVVKMQVNPLIFDFTNEINSTDNAERAILQYADDSGDCRRQIDLFVESSRRSRKLGTRDCDDASKRVSVPRDYEGLGLRKIVRSLDLCAIGNSGISRRDIDDCVVTLRIPREPQGSALLVKLRMHEESVFFRRNFVMGQRRGWSEISASVFGDLYWLSFDPEEGSRWVDIQVRRSKIPTLSEYVDRYEDLTYTWMLIESRFNQDDLSRVRGVRGWTAVGIADYWIGKGANTKEEFGRLHLKESQRRSLFLESVYRETGLEALRPAWLAQEQ